MVQYSAQAFWHIYGICTDGVDKFSATQFFLNGKQEYTLTKGLSFLNFPTTHILFYLMIFCFFGYAREAKSKAFISCLVLETF